MNQLDIFLCIQKAECVNDEARCEVANDMFYQLRTSNCVFLWSVYEPLLWWLDQLQSCTCTLAVLNCYIKLSPHVTYRLTIFKISLKLKSGEIIKKGIFPIMILCTTPCLNKSNSACATQSIYKPEYWIANHDLWFIHNTL